jgi:hypothetical protein
VKIIFRALKRVQIVKMEKNNINKNGISHKNTIKNQLKHKITIKTKVKEKTAIKVGKRERMAIKRRITAYNSN